MLRPLQYYHFTLEWSPTVQQAWGWTLKPDGTSLFPTHSLSHLQPAGRPATPLLVSDTSLPQGPGTFSTSAWQTLPPALITYKWPSNQGHSDRVLHLALQLYSSPTSNPFPALCFKALDTFWFFFSYLCPFNTSCGTRVEIFYIYFVQHQEQGLSACKYHRAICWMEEQK